MGTTANKLAYLNDTKTAIKTAIVGSGIDVPDGTTFRAYADKVDSIVGQFSDELDDIIGGALTPVSGNTTFMPPGISTFCLYNAANLIKARLRNATSADGRSIFYYMCVSGCIPDIVLSDNIVSVTFFQNSYLGPATSFEQEELNNVIDNLINVYATLTRLPEYGLFDAVDRELINSWWDAIFATLGQTITREANSLTITENDFGITLIQVEFN